MAKGISIHIGLNKVMREVYDSECRLPWCINDAAAMRNIAAVNGFDWLLLLNQKATKKHLLNALKIAAAELRKDDILLVTFSGHGDRIDDKNDDEEGDNKDDVWCMYDGRLSDDLLYEAWKRFRKGVRIVVVSDSCYSGTIIKPVIGADSGKFDEYDLENPNSIWNEYWTVLIDNDTEENVSSNQSLVATVILLAACTEKQRAAGNSESSHSLFTHCMLKVWDNGNFNGNYETFLKAIADITPSYYNPQYMVEGFTNKAFERQKPFMIY